ncbi:hypothetical protein JIR23_08655 [Bradyrhizobium diazoefficiens]|nr:hypothetical protein [Bradyrhizobium diazoefficiens]QQN65741.1 hypothetical protein JIR23_08655 [Bradyrhizobium diazoefficiens]
MIDVPCTVLMIHDGASRYSDIARRQAKMAGFEIVELNDLAKFVDDDWLHFERHYKHTSVNSLSFEKACFKRYFRAKEYTRRTGVDEFVMIDTDLMLFPSALSAGNSMFSRMRAEGRLAGVSVCVSPEDYWHASPHCSFWTSRGVNDFVDYVKHLVEDEAAFSAMEESARVRSNYPGFSDMVALGGWMKENNRVFNILTSISDGLWDHNVTLGCQNERKFLNVFGSKLLTSRAGQPCVFEFGERSANRVNVHSLHMQGRAKVAMRSVERGQLMVANVLLMALGFLKFSRQTWRNVARAVPQK